MVEFMTGDYQTVVDEKTGAVKVKLNPLESFMKTINDDSLQMVEDTLVSFWNSTTKVQPDVTSEVEKVVPPPPPSEDEDAIIRDLEEKIKLAQSAIEQRKQTEKQKKISELQAQLHELQNM